MVRHGRYWREALDNADLAGLGLHFHDLRHTANDFVAARANLRDQMTRMGHASPRAALIYQHASRDRERQITEDLSREIEAVRAGRSGTFLARPRSARWANG
jgi:integrase